MTPSPTDYTTIALLDQEEFRAALRQEAKFAVRCVLEQAMCQELTALLQALPFERAVTRTGRRNGYRRRDLITPLGVLEALRVPRDRAGQYQTKVFDRFARYQSEIIETLTGMFFQGVSESKVGQVIAPLLEKGPSASTVSRLAHDLEYECEQWRTRALKAHYRVIYLDGVYFPVLHEGKRDETPVLVALGVDEQGQKEVLALSVAGAESTEAWQGLMDDLKRRGVQQVDLFVTDGDEGLIGVLARAFPSARRQRCITHKERNVVAKIPARMKKPVAATLKEIFAQPSREEALAHVEAFRVRYEKIYPEAVACLQRDLADCLTFYDFPRAMWKYIRTTNVLEGLFHTTRQRTNKIGAFRNETSCVLLMFAVIQSVRFRRIPV
jgi:transposase-like protein